MFQSVFHFYIAAVTAVSHLHRPVQRTNVNIVFSEILFAPKNVGVLIQYKHAYNGMLYYCLHFARYSFECVRCRKSIDGTNRLGGIHEDSYMYA